MSDHADIVREALRLSHRKTDAWDAAYAALDALVAERDEARERGNTWHDHFENVNSQLKIKQVECDDITARALAAEAEVARLREALVEMCRTNHDGHQTPFQVEQMFHALAAAALAAPTKEGT